MQSSQKHRTETDESEMQTLLFIASFLFADWLEAIFECYLEADAPLMFHLLCQGTTSMWGSF